MVKYYNRNETFTILRLSTLRRIYRKDIDGFIPNIH